MNKVLIAILFLGIGLSSCRKDRKCECIEEYNGAIGTPTLTTYKKATRAEARAACHSFKEELPAGSGKYRNVTCKLQ